MRARYWRAFAALALLGGCAHSLDRRWASAEFEETPAFHAALIDQQFRDPSLARGAYASVSVYSYPMPVSGPGAVTLRELSDHGQLAYIETLGRLGRQADALRAALAKPIGGAAAASSTDPMVDESEFARTLVVSVAKDAQARPGDRLMRTVVEIAPDGGFRFAGYKIVATDTRTLNVEHLEQSTTTSLQANLSAKPPIPAGIQAGLTGGATNGQSSSTEIAPSFENLSVDITPPMLRITRESERNLDLTGNTIIALSLFATPDAVMRSEGERFQLASATSLYRGETPLSPARASLHLARLQTLGRCPVTASVRMLYQVRKIEAGERSYDEGTQSVRIVSDATKPVHATLIPAEDLTGPLYGILAEGRLIEADDRKARLPLVFADYELARDMARWMAAMHARGLGSGVRLLLGGDPIPETYPTTLTAIRVDRAASVAQCGLTEARLR